MKCFLLVCYTGCFVWAAAWKQEERVIVNSAVSSRSSLLQSLTKLHTGKKERETERGLLLWLPLFLGSLRFLPFCIASFYFSSLLFFLFVSCVYGSTSQTHRRGQEPLTTTKDGLETKTNHDESTSCICHMGSLESIDSKGSSEQIGCCFTPQLSM